MKTSSTITGVIIIIVGVLLLLMNFDLIDFDFDYIWPMFILLPGLIFELSYFSTRKDPGLLVPGGILTTIGLLFYINNLYGWHLMDRLWPIFPLAVAIGLFQLYLFGPKDTGVLIASSIVGGFALISLSFTLFSISFDLVFPVLLIAIGCLVIFNNKKDS